MKAIRNNKIDLCIECYNTICEECKNHLKEYKQSVIEEYINIFRNWTNKEILDFINQQLQDQNNTDKNDQNSSNRDNHSSAAFLDEVVEVSQEKETTIRKSGESNKKKSSYYRNRKDKVESVKEKVVKSIKEKVVKSTKQKKRDRAEEKRVEERVEDQEIEENDDGGSVIEHSSKKRQIEEDESRISKNEYIRLQKVKAEELLTKMKDEYDDVYKVFEGRKELQFPEIEQPNPLLATRKEGLKFWDKNKTPDGKRSLNVKIFTQKLAVLENESFVNVKKLTKLGKWSNIITYCYTMAGFLKSLGQTDSYDDVKDQYKIIIDGIKKAKKKVALPRFFIAKLHARLGDFLVRYPKFFYQIQLTSILGWTDLNLKAENKICSLPIQERNTFRFIEEILNDRPELQSFWSTLDN
jgi:hypothetical protein